MDNTQSGSMDIEYAVQRQRDFFNSDATLNPAFRKKMLERLHVCIKKHEDDILAALKLDLGKDEFESYETEFSLVLNEIKLLKHKVKSWAKPKRVHMPLMHFHSIGHIYNEPYGVVLIISPWNYPFLLTMMPLVGAIAAGNCCIIKPSEYSVHTSEIIAQILQETFKSEYVNAILGDYTVSDTLLNQQFDYIFFTGSTDVGRIVMEKAAQHLTLVTLELGGKSPCIVDSTSDVKLAAKRIVWGKFMNSGQTCIAPDYVYVQSSVKDALVEAMKMYIKEFYGRKPIRCGYLPKIINKKHFERLNNLLAEGNILHGGHMSESKNMIEPTLIDGVDWGSAIMKEEIFGPLLPIMTFETFDEMITTLKGRDKPLALYFFTKSKKNENEVISRLSFGGGCVNDTIIHIANENMPFGGVGKSGIGQYHGKFSLETFSRMKSVVKKYNYIDVFLRYPPFKKHLSLLRKII